MNDNIKQSQKEYYNLIEKYKPDILSDNVTAGQILLLIDEIQCFWIDRLEIISFELDALTKENDCFVLSGSVYLDVQDNEHYLFKLVGDYHLLYDPLLKLENIFRGQIQMDDDRIIEVFKRSYRDVIDVLSVYGNYFYILPLQEISTRNYAAYSKKQTVDYLMSFTLSFVSSIFDKDYKNFEQFYQEFESYKSLEKEMTPFIRKNLIFLEHGDSNLSLEKRCENYIKEQGISNISKQMTEANRFIIVLTSRVAQIADIIKTSATLNAIPFIRCPITFQYLLMVMYSFLEDSYLKYIIEKAIIAYFCCRIFNQDIIERNNFDDYCNVLSQGNILNSVITKVRQSKIDIFSNGLNEAKVIIEEEFLKLNEDFKIANCNE